MYVALCYYKLDYYDVSQASRSSVIFLKSWIFQKKIFKFWMCMEILYSLWFCLFYRKSWLCTCNIIQTGKLPVKLLKVWKFENYSLLIWLQAVHKLPVMVEKLINYYNYYWLIIEVLFVVIHSATAVNLKACNHFRLYNGKAAEVSSQEKNWH